MRALILWSLMIPFVLGCPGKDDGSGDESDADTDSDSDSDTDTDSDTDADGAACSSYSGITGVGNAWEWDFAIESKTGTQTAEVTAYNAGSGAVTIESVLDYGDDYGSYYAATTSQYNCDAEGMKISASVTDYEITYSDTTTTGTTTLTYTTPYLVLLKDLANGDSWTATVAGTSEDSNYGTTPFDYEVSYEVTGEEDVSVEAGDYSTLVLEANVVGEISQSNLAKNVGTVKTSNTELVSYTE